MLDDLRNSVTSDFPDEPFIDHNPYPEEKPARARGPFLGMTAAQRFIISLFLFLMVAVVGGFVLIVFQKVAPGL